MALQDSAEKAGLRNAWDRVAREYEDLWSARLAPYMDRALDLLAPGPAGHAVDICCGPGVTTAALARRLPRGSALGVDFSASMVERAAAGRPWGLELSFAVDDAERLSLPSAAFDAAVSGFGLMYCYDSRAALAEMARVVRPGGRIALATWGSARRVWWSPVIELIESRAGYYASICPMIFFYGLPGVVARMAEETGLKVVADELMVDTPMRYPDVASAADAAILGGPLAGLFTRRLDAERQGEVRAALGGHVREIATRDADGIALPAEVRVTVLEV
jgi:ubiquinone/menaquinone biosynthesis C-methylase UbiE